MNTQDVIWGGGQSPRSKYVHAYVSKEAYDRGECLCGRKVVPAIKYDKWDLDNELAKEHTCEGCLDRLKLMRFV